MSHHTNSTFLLLLLLQILFTPSYDESPDRKNGSLYRLHPTSNTYTQAVLAFVRQFNWQRFSVLTRGGGFFDEVCLYLFLKFHDVYYYEIEYYYATWSRMLKLEVTEKN